MHRCVLFTALTLKRACRSWLADRACSDAMAPSGQPGCLARACALQRGAHPELYWVALHGYVLLADESGVFAGSG
eukprot:12024734-Alexandrium_andersonii.AAC.1